MPLTTILHLMIALAYLLAGHAARREGKRGAALRELFIATLYTLLALIDLPLVGLGHHALPHLA
jgi:hypothetical protein